MTEIPDTGTWYNGELDTSPQQYDVLVAARGNVSIETAPELNLIVTPYETPDFFTNDNRKIVFAEPQPMGTVRMPKGHSDTIVVRIHNITPQNSNFADYIWLGLRDKGVIIEKIRKDEVVYVDLTDSNDIEFIPLLSTSPDKYVEVKPGGDIMASGIPISSTQCNFSSVYRISISGEPVVTWEEFEQTAGHSLNDIEPSPFDSCWKNRGNIYAGQLRGEKKLLVISGNGQLASSSNWAEWEKEGNPGGAAVYYTAPVFGNNTWCVLQGGGGGIKYLDPDTQTWLTGSINFDYEPLGLSFDNGMFITKSGVGSVFTSSDNCKTWDYYQYVINSKSYDYSIIFDKNAKKWINFANDNSYHRTIYESPDETGAGEWAEIPNNLKELLSFFQHYVDVYACYANGYFYAISASDNDTLILRSRDKKKWKYVGKLNNAYMNIAFHNGKLYSVNKTHYAVGTFQ